MYSSNRLLGPLADTQPTHIYAVGVLRSGSGSESGAVRRRTGNLPLRYLIANGF
jgi:hypothetical protein